MLSHRSVIVLLTHKWLDQKITGPAIREALCIARMPNA